MKFCTKCKNELSDNVIFCPECGTKQYIPIQEKEHQGKLLVMIPKCKVMMLGVLSVECALHIWDNCIAAVGNGGKKHMDLSLTAIASVDVSNQKLSIKSMKDKVYQITFPEDEADFVPYIRDLIWDYRAHCLETGSYAKVNETMEFSTKFTGMGIGLWMKEKSVSEQNGLKGNVVAQKMYVAKTGNPFRFCGLIYQNLQQLCAGKLKGSYTDVYGRMGTWQDVRFPVFDSSDATCENRYWRYFYMHENGVLHLLVFQDEILENGHWKSESASLDVEIFENVEKVEA